MNRDRLPYATEESFVSLGILMTVGMHFENVEWNIYGTDDGTFFRNKMSSQSDGIHTDGSG